MEKKTKKAMPTGRQAIKKTAKRKIKKPVPKKKISKSSVNKMIADFIKRIEAI